MNWKSFFDNPEELIISGLCASIPLYWIIGWWVIPMFVAVGLLWRLGGWEHGHKAFRWLGVPLIVTLATYLTTHRWLVFLAIPFMVKIAPSYGKNSWLYKLLKNDFLTRLICFAWYWAFFAIAYSVR